MPEASEVEMKWGHAESQYGHRKDSVLGAMVVKETPLQSGCVQVAAAKAWRLKI